MEDGESREAGKQARKSAEGKHTHTFTEGKGRKHTALSGALPKSLRKKDVSVVSSSVCLVTICQGRREESQVWPRTGEELPPTSSVGQSKRQQRAIKEQFARE